ncbi:MAG: amidohydrolase family protein [Chloroflexi bacterium]|nr:amidohydrolase family protein [Chloroflexota bacterium]
MLDILIRDGRVVDGTGQPAYPADVAIQGDRIVAVERLPGAAARRVVDAAGKVVCPGFVDAHSHTDWSIQANPTAESTIRQGITTEIVGHCGWSNAPVSDLSRAMIAGRLQTYAYDGPVEWATFGEYLDVVGRPGFSCNLAWFVGHNAVRAAAGVVGPHATVDQLRAMEGYVREAMEAGALGLSTGLEFEPGRMAPTEEIVRLARVAGEYGGHYASHIRNRDASLQPAIEEFLEVVRRGGVRGEVSHLNVRHNTGAPEGAWGRAVDTLDRARWDGLDVLADTTPFQDGIGQMAGILPPWVMAEGPARAAELLREPAVRRRLRGECDRYWRFIHRGEWHRVRLQGSAEYPELSGQSFVEIADRWHQDPWDCYFDILAAAGPKLESVIVVARLFTPEHVAEMARHPLFNLAVDTFSSRIDGPLAERTRHPLSYAGMVHYLTHHVRERRTLQLEEAIRKMTSMPATHHGLRDQGLLRAGDRADVVVFDLDRLADVSTVERPLAYARGVEHVLVNGVFVVDGGAHTGARPGRVLRRG